MELDEESVFDSKSSINSKLNYFSYEHPYPPPVSEGRNKLLFFLVSSFSMQMNWNIRKFATLQIGLNIELVQRNSSPNILIRFFVHILFTHLHTLVTKHFSSEKSKIMTKVVKWYIHLKREKNVSILIDLYRRVNALKKRNPKLKTILGVGGWNMKSYAFSIMVHDSAKRKRFIFDTIK